MWASTKPTRRIPVKAMRIFVPTVDRQIFTPGIPFS